jgi:hypothetical protein
VRVEFKISFHASPLVDPASPCAKKTLFPETPGGRGATDRRHVHAAQETDCIPDRI